MRLCAEMGIYNVYFAVDRDFGSDAKFWNLLEADDPTQLSEGGEVWKQSLGYFALP
jgi:hypothetical protein